MNMYKNIVLAQCRFMQHIPGLKGYGRFMERCYTKRFWTTMLIGTLVSIVMNTVMIKLVDRYIKQVNKESYHGMSEDMSWMDDISWYNK